MILTNGRSDALRAELQQPRTTLGRRYLGLLIVTITLSVLYLFVQEEYPGFAPLGSPQLLLIELAILTVFTVDFGLRIVTMQRSFVDAAFLLIDFLAIVPSAVVVLHYAGAMDGSQVEFLALLRLFRLARILKLLRMQNAVVNIFGASVLTLVFGVMTFHLGLRVLLLEMSRVLNLDIVGLFDQDALMIAVPAVGSVFGIALAITFGIAKRKQIEISELHRLALDALDAIEADIKRIAPDTPWTGTQGWRADIARFLNEEISYPEIKARTKHMLADVRAMTITRPSLDVPYHNNLVAKISQFLTKTQIEFHPVFYLWLNRIAQLYFILVLLAAPGLTGVFVQMLVIFVFQGLVVIIDDMDHAVDTKVTLFNSKILEV